MPDNPGELIVAFILGMGTGAMLVGRRLRWGKK